MVVNQYDIFWVQLKKTKGSEIRKTRPAVVISPNEMNHNINTVIIAPMIRTSKNYPTRLKVKFNNNTGWVVLDQIRCIDKVRLLKKAGSLSQLKIKQLKDIIMEMLIE